MRKDYILRAGHPVHATNIQSGTASRVLGGLLLLLALFASATTAAAEPKFKRTQPQYIATLAAPDATSGAGAETWGLWRKDPGPRGVWLKYYPALKTMGVAPHGWRFDKKDWWLDENGLIMEQPDFPMPAGKYLVTGGREVASVLTVHAKDASGKQRWELAKKATIHDVTHLGCRSARYTPAGDENSCSPSKAPMTAFKVAPGADMPAVKGCKHQDYAVLIIIGIAVE